MEKGAKPEREMDREMWYIPIQQQTSHLKKKGREKEWERRLICSMCVRTSLYKLLRLIDWMSTDGSCWRLLPWRRRLHTASISLIHNLYLRAQASPLKKEEEEEERKVRIWWPTTSNKRRRVRRTKEIKDEPTNQFLLWNLSNHFFFYFHPLHAVTLCCTTYDDTWIIETSRLLQLLSFSFFFIHLFKYFNSKELLVYMYGQPYVPRVPLHLRDYSSKSFVEKKSRIKTFFPLFFWVCVCVDERRPRLFLTFFSGRLINSWLRRWRRRWVCRARVCAAFVSGFLFFSFYIFSVSF